MQQEKKSTKTALDKFIPINVEAKLLVPFKGLKVVQGDLKDLTEEGFKKLKKSILKYGITAPFNVWLNENGIYEVLDGTQRHRVISMLNNEGYIVDHVPVNLVKADNHKQAMQILLTHASQYGKPQIDGFTEFITQENLDIKEIMDTSTFDHFLEDMTSVEEIKEDTEPTSDLIKCPKCEFEWHTGKTGVV